MLGSQTGMVAQILANINTSLAQYAVAGVRLTQINMVLPDGRSLVLLWDGQAHDNGDGTFTGDWVIETHS